MIISKKKFESEKEYAYRMGRISGVSESQTENMHLRSVNEALSKEIVEMKEKYLAELQKRLELAELVKGDTNYEKTKDNTPRN